MDVLQPGFGPRRGLYVPCETKNLSWGWILPAGSEPLATVRPGETVCVDTISHEGVLEDQGRDPLSFFGGFGVAEHEVLEDAVALARSSVAHDQGRDGPHVITGPIWVEGAEPGDLLCVEVLELWPRVPYGIVSNRHGRGALPGQMPQPGPDGVVPQVVCRFATADWEAGKARMLTPEGTGMSFPLRPFLGLVAVAPGDRPAHSVPPGPHGGNLDVRLLGVGSRLYLPVQAPGALLQVGDPHFAQGDGEVALTALEGSLRALLRLDLIKGAAPAWGLPYGETGDAWLIAGLDEDLDEAVKKATWAALSFVCERTGADRASAYAWLSVAADLVVSQVVDQVKGVHFVLPKKWMACEP